MSFAILYRSAKTGKVHPVIRSDAWGIMEFDTADEAARYLGKTPLPENTPTQIVDLRFL